MTDYIKILKTFSNNTFLCIHVCLPMSISRSISHTQRDSVTQQTGVRKTQGNMVRVGKMTHDMIEESAGKHSRCGGEKER